MRSKSRRIALVLAAIAAGTVFPAAARAQEVGCSSSSTGGTIERTLGDRSYLLNVPEGLGPGPVPLLLSLHGFGSNGAVVESNTGWTPFAAANRFIVAYPQARPFEYGGAWEPYTRGSVDVGFLRSVVADIAATWCVDPRHVHFDGWSNGAVMSQRMACAAADLVASVTSYGGGTPTAAGFAEPCRPSRPISVGLFAGQFDFTYAGLSQNAGEWRTLNGCAATPARSTDAYGTTETHACAAGTTVLARTVANTSHNWPFGAQAEDQRRRMWQFFMANPRP